MSKRTKPISDTHDGAEAATVVTTCPDCGPVRVGARSVVVFVDAGAAGAVRVAFACPACRPRTTHQLERKVLPALRAIGVSVRLLTRPAEADEAHDGPPLTTADVDAFCAAMEDPAWPRSLR